MIPKALLAESFPNLLIMYRIALKTFEETGRVAVIKSFEGKQGEKTEACQCLLQTVHSKHGESQENSTRVSVYSHL